MRAVRLRGLWAGLAGSLIVMVGTIWGPALRAASGAAGMAGTGMAVSAQRVGAPRTLPAHFFGFNAESIVQPIDDQLLANSAALHAKMDSIPVGVLRIPGGTTSQWLDWRTGHFIDAANSPFAAVDPRRRAITMARWAAIVRGTDAMPLWDLNVLTSTLPDQIAMLRKAQRLGLPVRYIELGNELWNPLAPYPDRFPTGAAYGSAMNPWIAALKRHFPKAKIAVSGADETAPSLLATVGGARFATWNKSVLSAVRGEDAIAIHPYWVLPNSAPSGSEVAATLAAGQDHWAAFARGTLHRLPARLRVWLTEWNQSGLGAGDGTEVWAQALSAAAVTFDQLADQRVTISLIHDLVGGARNPQDFGGAKGFPLFTDGVAGSRVLARTALGYAVPLIYSTAAGATRVQRLRVRGVPKVGDQPGVVGMVLFAGHRAKVLLVNLTSRAISVRLPTPLSGRATLTSLQSPPGAQPGWVPGNSVRTAERTVHGSVRLPPYSVDRVLSRRTRR